MAHDSGKRYEYFAFISYKREDERTAKWLQNKLESYSLPTSLRKGNPELPSRIRPIFRDQSELSGGILKVEIEKGLDNSKFLIVVCSPRSAKSPWVSAEVAHFIKEGREAQIIPFIIDGEPNASDPSNECFPEELRKLTRDQELLGINVEEMGRNAAVVKTIARMFGLKFDTLWQRFEKKKRLRRILYTLAAVAVVLVSLGVAAFIMNQNRILENTNRSLLEAQKKISIQQDSLRTVNRGLVVANDSLKSAKQHIALSRDSLKLSNESLNRTNRLLEETNLKLVEEKLQVVEQKRRVAEKNVSLLLSSANERMARGEMLAASEAASEAIRMYASLGADNVEAELAALYESTLRRIDRAWEDPGLHWVNSISLENTVYGGWVNDEIVIPTHGTNFKKWDYQMSSTNLGAVRNFGDVTNTLALDVFDTFDQGKFLECENGVLGVRNAKTNKSIGHTIDVGRSWLHRKYKFSKTPDCVLIVRDSIITRFNYMTGTSDTLRSGGATVTAVEESPANPSLLAFVTADSCITLINGRTKKILEQKKFAKQIGNVAFHPQGDYIVAVGDDISLLTKRLDELATYNGGQVPRYQVAKFNADGSKLYAYSHDGNHTVLSVGYLPNDYSLLSGDGRYRVNYVDGYYRLSDNEQGSEIPDLKFKYGEGKFVAFGTLNNAVLINRWDNELKTNKFELFDLKRATLAPLPALDSRLFDECFAIDELEMAYQSNNDTLKASDYSGSKSFVETGKKIVDLKYSSPRGELIGLSSGGVLYTIAPDLSTIKVLNDDLNNIAAFALGKNGELFVAEKSGYIYWLDEKGRKQYLAIETGVDEISVDSSGRYLLAQYSYHPKLEFSFGTKPYGYNTVSSTRIYDIASRALVEDVSAFKLETAKLIRDYKGDVAIDAGRFMMPLREIKTVERRILERHKKN